MTTLIQLFHPEYAKSKANRALIAAAEALDDVTVVDMYALYPDLRAIDVEAEAARLYTADGLIWQFPIHWYAVPPLFQAWANVVLTRMFYIHPKDEGERIRDLPVMAAATAGNEPSAYAPEGVNLFPLAELLKPLHSTAHRCALRWADPFLIYRSNKSSPEELAEAGRRYAARIEEWRGTERKP